MHETIIKWLGEFENDCRFGTPTRVYESLVMLGVDNPETCDCIGIIDSEEKYLSKLMKEDLLSMDRQSVILNGSAIQNTIEHRDLYVSLHKNHKDINFLVWKSLSVRLLLQKVRGVCLRDLRLPETKIANREYGERLKGFLVKNPVGWLA